MRIIERTNLDETIEKSVNGLRHQFRTPSEKESGWYHFLDDLKPGVTASAVGLYIFQTAGANFESSSSVVDYIVAQQIKDGEKAGGWGVRTTHGFPLVESTAWVVRALAPAQTRHPTAAEALKGGVDWLIANQNKDFGWGSYYGRESRTFLTCLSIVALVEAGAPTDPIDNGIRWLNNNQDAHLPAWPAIPRDGQKPTLLHTAWALTALNRVPGAISQDTKNRIVAWIHSQVDPEVMVERAHVEEYDVPYEIEGRQDTFQNALPHFAMPLAVAASLDATGDLLHNKWFDAVSTVIDLQQAGGTWELPRSPDRPSIWAMWPQVQLLTAVRDIALPTPEGQLNLLQEGIATFRSREDSPKLTRHLIAGSAVRVWLAKNWIGLAFGIVCFLYVGIGVLSLLLNKIDGTLFLVGVVLPVLLSVAVVLLASLRRGKPD